MTLLAGENVTMDGRRRGRSAPASGGVTVSCVDGAGVVGACTEASDGS